MYEVWWQNLFVGSLIILFVLAFILAAGSIIWFIVDIIKEIRATFRERTLNDKSK
jgi:hypothetical protein